MMNVPRIRRESPFQFRQRMQVQFDGHFVMPLQSFLCYSHVDERVTVSIPADPRVNSP